MSIKKRLIAALMSCAVIASAAVVPSSYAVDFDVDDVDLELLEEEENINAANAAFDTDLDIVEESDINASSNFSDFATDSKTGLMYRIYTDPKTGKKSAYVYSAGFKDSMNNLHPNNTTTSVTIPATLGGAPVTYIGDYAFRNHTALQKVVMPDSVTEIGISSFNGCTALTNVTFSKNLKGLSVYSFENCTALRDVALPDTVQYIYIGSFHGCTSLNSFHIPSRLTYCGGNGSIFNGCLNLRKITFSKYTFLEASKKSTAEFSSDKLYIPASVNEITVDGGKLNTVKDSSTYEFIILGFAGSYAEKFAKAQGVKFLALKPNGLGDIDGDNAIDALDASAVLIAYSQMATKTSITINDVQLKAADVDKNGAVDALDASAILSYYAYTATGGNDTIENFLKK